MVRLISIFAILLLSTLLGIQLSQDPGYVLISFKQWSVETSLLFALFSLFLLFFIFYSLLNFLFHLLNLPSSWSQWREKRRRKKAQRTTRKGLIEFSEGYWKKAKKHLTQALPDSDMPLLNYLTAARASQNLGDNKLRDQYLREAQRALPEAKVAIELTQAELQIANQQWEQALATLKHLQDLAPHHPYVLKLLMQLYEQVNDWPQLSLLLTDLKKNQVLKYPEYEQLQFKTSLENVKMLVKTKAIEELNALMADLPKALYFEPEINRVYCQFLINENHYGLAEERLRACLKKQAQSSDLLQLYGLCPYQSEQQRIFAESLIKKAPQSAMLYLTLGRLCLQEKLWGKAEHYLEKSIELQPGEENHFELGRLFEQLNEPLKAGEEFKKAILFRVGK